ncbi:MAG: hypothetical protein RIG63_27555 [Coleofasciculus chthonoplastes F3-SA18-01]|uniref:hypothetical protein n=1 Tax=Coleofasciculus chthonoplastes TaxID=64178 RepID=UPI0032FDDFDA
MTISHLEVLVEEYSAKVALDNLLPKILPSDVEFELHSFQGKSDLLKKLPQRLKGYRSWLPDDWRIVVLCDRDNDDYQDLKKALKIMPFSVDLQLNSVLQANNSPYSIALRLKSLKPGF